MDEWRWDDLKVFLAIYREGSLVGAGRRLACDASTISRRLAALEHALSKRLFERTVDGLIPNDAARAILAPAEAVEASTLQFARMARNFELDVSGLVRVAMMPGTAAHLSARLLAGLLEQYPRLRVELVVGRELVDLSRNDADLAIRSVRPDRGDYIHTRLLRARWLLMASPTVAERTGVLERWDAVDWVGWGRGNTRTPAAAWLATTAPDVEPAVRSNDVVTQLAAVEAGIGVGLFSEAYLSARSLQPIRVGPALVEEASRWPVDDVWLVAHPAMRTVPRVAAVWDYVTATFGAAGPH